MRKQESAAFLNFMTVVRIPRLDQAFNTEPTRITEATAPTTVPGAIFSLNALQKVLALVDGMNNLLGTMIREHMVKLVQSSQRGHGAFHI
jgi:hypothetical protein